MSISAVVFGSPVTSNIFGVTGTVEVDADLGRVHVPHGDFLLSAEYARVGPHLSLSEGETSVLVKNFFTFKTVPDLLTEDGSSVIDGALAIRLAGPLAPGQFAQVGQLAQVTTSPSIGVIEKLEGIVSLTRTDGTTVQAAKGTQVFTGDIVKTGADANVGIKFTDETNFALGESGRMVIDEMIYDPGANTGSSSFSVVKGVFSFVSGKVAKFGDDAMVVKTPVASIGIRGTTVAGKAAAEGTSNSITLLPDADGGVGQIAVTNSAGTQVMSIPFQTTTLSSAFTLPAVPVVLPSNQLQNLYGNIKTSLSFTNTNTNTPEGQSNDAGTSDNKGAAEVAPEGEGEGEGEGDEGPGEGDEGPGEGDGPPGEGDEPPGEGDEPPGEGDEGPGEGDEPPGEGDLVPTEGGDPDDPARTSDGGEAPVQQADANEPRPGDSEDDQPRVDRYGNAKDAFDEARESGLTEEEAFEKAAKAVGVTEEEQLVAEEAFNRAIAEGADPREAVYQAENAVREEFDRSDRDKQFEESFDAQVDATSSALSVAVRSGVTAEEAINAQLSGLGTTSDDVYVVREAAYRAIDDAFENGDASSLGLLLGEGGPNASKGETTFREALISGKSIDEAFQSAFAANAGSAERDANGRIDFLGADLFAQGFDPFLQLRSKIFEATEEIIIQNDVEGDAINSFAEIFSLRTLNDVLVGDNDTNQFEAIQGSSLGGTDTIDGDGGTDELKISDIVNGLFIVTFASGGDFVVDYSTDGGNIEGKITATNVEQLFVQEVGGSQQRVGTDDDDGIGVIFAGTSGNDTINAFGDGTLANDLAIGSKGVNTDDPKVFGSILLGGAGNDVITSDGGNALIFGGDGNDIITVKGKTGDGEDVVQAGAGDDTVIIIEPTDFRTPDRSADQFNFDQLSGGDNENSGNGDVLQIGNSGSATDQIFITAESSGAGSIVGFETLNFFRSGTIFQANEIVLINFDRIITESGVSNVTLKASFSNLNLSNVTLDGGIANLTGISGVATGLQIFDSNSDSVGRTLIGTAEDDFLSGFGGNDVFQMGGGFDQLVGGSGDDTFQIAAETDITKGISISGGSGTDTLLLTSTSIASLEFPTTDSGGGTRPDDVNFATLEIFDVSGGSASGVSIEMRGSDLSAIPQFVGDGTSDKIKVLFDDLDLRGDTLTGIQEISFTASNTGQTLNLSASTSLSGLNKIAGTVNSSSVADESILLQGSRDFSGINLLDFESISLQDGNGVRQTIDVNSSTSFGLAEIRNFTTGTGSTTDVFDYKSNLVAGDGTTLSSGADLTLTTIDSSARATNVISANSTAVIEFEFTDLSIDLTNSSNSAIVSAVEALLESTDASTNLTGANAGVTQGGVNTDSLLIFYESDDSGGPPGEDAVIIRYSEGSTSEADYSGELFVLSVFDSLSAGSGPDDTFTDTNII